MRVHEDILALYPDAVFEITLLPTRKLWVSVTIPSVLVDGTVNGGVGKIPLCYADFVPAEQGTEKSLQEIYKLLQEDKGQA